jgi:hypothetical protein
MHHIGYILTGVLFSSTVFGQTEMDEAMAINLYTNQNCDGGWLTAIALQGVGLNTCHFLDVNGLGFNSGVGSINIANCYEEDCGCQVYTSTDCTGTWLSFGTPGGVGVAPGPPYYNCISTSQTIYEFGSYYCQASHQ